MLFKKNTTTPQRPNRRLVSRRRLHARAAASREEIEDYESESEPSMKLSQAFIVVLILHVVAVGGIYGFNKLKESTAKPVAAKKEAVTEVAPKAPEAVAESKPQAPVAKPAASESAGQSYTVVAGDTLKKIAAKLNTSIEALEKANNLTSTSIIRTGQVLTIGKASAAQPAAAPVKTAPVPVSQATPMVVAKPAPAQPVAAKTAPVAAAEPAKEAAPASGKTYVVAKGDNPYSIAKKLKVTQEALMKANNIDDPRKLKIGQTLAVP
jgi:LysM repeat protein